MIQIYKKPELMVLSESKKLRLYDETERLTISKKIIENLLNKLGVGNKSNEQHHIAAIKFISENKEYAPEEFDKAFNLAIEGILGVDIFQQVNCVVIGKVMVAYRNYRTENLKSYKHQQQLLKLDIPMTPEEIEFSMIEGCDRIFREYKLNHKIEGVYVHIYDHLFKKGLLPRDKFYKDAIFAKAQVIAISEVKANARENNEPKKTMERAIKEIEDKINLTPIAIAKRLALEDYFQKLVLNNENLNDKI